MADHRSASQYLVGFEHPDVMRAYRRKEKSMALVDKRTSVTDAVSRYLSPGATLALGGFGSVRNPMTVIYEIIRQRIGNLTVFTKGSQHDWHLLGAAGLVSRVEVSYGFGDEIRGLNAPTRRAVQSGRLQVVSELTNAGAQWRFLAAMMGLSFIPTRSGLGTDTLKHSGYQIIEDPFTKEPVALIPACYPDVAVIHVHRCDIYGNCQIDGNVTMDKEIAYAAKRLIISTERIIPHEEIRRRPDHTTIPYFLVDAVVQAPYGAHPNNMPLLYSYDERHWQQWLDASATDEGVADYLDRYVYGVSPEEYRERVGGLEYLRTLETIEAGVDPYPPVAKKGGTSA